MPWAYYDSATGKFKYSQEAPAGTWKGDPPGRIPGPGTVEYYYPGQYSGAWSRKLEPWRWVAEIPGSTPTPSVAPVLSASTVTGIAPSDVGNALYGKVIPLSVIGTSTFGGGLERIGMAGLLFGPYFNAGAASFAVSFGFPANPSGTRRVYEISLDGKVAWELAAGSPDGVLNPAGFLGDPFECRFYSGTLTQPADPLEIAMFGDQAVAYRPQMMLWFTDLPTAAFDNKCPFVSAKIGDVTGGAVAGDGINLGEALEAVAYSPWLEYDSSSFETSGVADIVQAMILTEDQSFLNMLQTTSRVYRTLDILQTDKLRVVDRGATATPDVTLHRDHISADATVQYFRQEQESVPRELELITIDPDADYVFMPSKAARPLTPVPVTASVAKETITLPVVIGATTRASLVTFAKYQEDNARKRISLQTMLYGYALEPGDLFNLTEIADGFNSTEVYKVVETSHGANYTNEIQGEAILKCAFYSDPDADPYFDDVILLLHANVGPPVDHSQYVEPMTLDGATVDTSVTRYGAASFLFDGTDDRVMTDSELTDARWDFDENTFTIELWVQFGRLDFGTNQIIVCRNGGLIGFAIWTLFILATTNQITFETRDGISVTSTTQTAVDDPALTLDTWYHLAVDKDSVGRIRLYVNGVMKAASSVLNPLISDTGEPLTLARSGNPTVQSPFQGNIDDVRVTARSRYGDIYGDASFSVPGVQFPDHA